MKQEYDFITPTRIKNFQNMVNCLQRKLNPKKKPKFRKDWATVSYKWQNIEVFARYGYDHRIAINYLDRNFGFREKIDTPTNISKFIKKLL